MAGADVARGELFGERFELHELLVRTSVGPVFRAFDSELEGDVGLLILDEAAESSGGAEALRAHVQLARKISHHNIARTFDLGECEGQHFLTVEFIDGVHLGPWLASQPSQAASLDVAAQLAEGLAAAHAAGVTHANLTLSCVLVEASGRAVLGNFGLAGFEAADTVAEVAQGREDVFRSVAYLAPEQIRGEPSTSAVDIYALGLMIYEMWTGEARYRAANPVLAANARFEDSLDDLREGPERDLRLPLALSSLLITCLVPVPAERCEAGELAASLRKLALSLGGTNESLEPDAPQSVRRCDSLAVLPFRFRGPRDSAYLAEALVDELVDLLSQTQGLSVFGAGSTARYSDVRDRDPKRLGAELDVDVIVDGTVLLAGERLRISARLIEVAGGFQLWHERFEGGVADVFELQDKLAKRIVEALRVELEIVAHRDTIDPEASEAYLRGRQAHLRWLMFGPEGALAHYREALALAPDFKPALAHLAVASVHAWFQPASDSTTDREHEAREAVARAMAWAPELAESRLAAGNLAAHDCEFYEAASHMREALRLAPTFSLAHELLGRMELEIGRGRTGVEHLELAAELDPALSYAHADIARYHALMGDLDAFHASVEFLLARLEHHRPSTGMVYMRVGGWFRDFALVRRGLACIEGEGPRVVGLRAYGEMLVGEPIEDLSELDAHYARTLAGALSPRFKSYVEQSSAELCAFHGFGARALAHIEAATRWGLIDLVWIDRCPLFDGLREDPSFRATRATVKARAEQIQSALAF